MSEKDKNKKKTDDENGGMESLIDINAITAKARERTESREK